MTTPDRSIEVSAILIAAGASTRLGQPKQLVEFKGGHLINYIITELNKSEITELIVILGAHYELINNSVISNAIIINNLNWKDGMSSSIIAGINNVNPDSAGILISLVDHYYLNTTLINELIFKFKAESNKVIVSRYSDNKIGPPVIFPKSYYPMLKELKGDKGAGVIINTLLKNDPNKIQLIDFPNGHLDLDTPEDLNNLNL